MSVHVKHACINAPLDVRTLALQQIVVNVMRVRISHAHLCVGIAHSTRMQEEHNNHDVLNTCG